MSTTALSDPSTHTEPSHDRPDQDIVMASMPAPNNDFPMIGSILRPPTIAGMDDANVRKWMDVDGMWTWAPQALTPPHLGLSSHPGTENMV